jgi:hypothetical protein
LDNRSIAGVIEIEIEAGREVEGLPMVPANGGGRRTLTFELLAIRDRSVEKSILPVVLTADSILQIPIGVPVQSHREIEVLIGCPVVSDVGYLPIVRRIGADDVVEAELGNQNSRMPARPHILKNEGEPENRDIADV